MSTTTENNGIEQLPESPDASIAFQELIDVRNDMESITDTKDGEAIKAAAKSVKTQSEKTPEQIADEATELRKLLANRAKRQRSLGEAELKKTYAGASVIVKDVKVYNPVLASSSQRYLGLVDRALYLLPKFSYFVDENVHALLMSKIEGEANHFIEFANNQYTVANTLLKSEKKKFDEASMDQEFEVIEWVQPVYKTTTLELQIHVKNPLTLKIINAVQKLDETQLIYSTLVWNGVLGDSENTEAIIFDSKKKMFKIFEAARDSIRRLFKRTTKQESNRASA